LFWQSFRQVAGGAAGGGWYTNVGGSTTDTAGMQPRSRHEARTFNEATLVIGGFLSRFVSRDDRR
jgi:hypothetical protein